MTIFLLDENFEKKNTKTWQLCSLKNFIPKKLYIWKEKVTLKASSTLTFAHKNTTNNELRLGSNCLALTIYRWRKVFNYFNPFTLKCLSTSEAVHRNTSTGNTCTSLFSELLPNVILYDCHLKKICIWVHLFFNLLYKLLTSN